MTSTSTRSPILLVAATQALVARPSLAVHRAHADSLHDEHAPNGMKLVQHAGYWSHYNARMGVSSWPFAPGINLTELLLLSERWGILREHGEVGDVVVRAPAGGEGAHVGIVMHVEHRVHLPGCELAQCDVAWEHRGWGDRPSARLARAWIRPSVGDRYIGWCDAPLRLTTRGRVA